MNCSSLPIAASTSMPHDDHVEELFYSVPEDIRDIPGARRRREAAAAAHPDRSVMNSLRVRRRNQLYRLIQKCKG